MAYSQWLQPKELLIPAPCGHIAAKVWGNENSEPILGLHGWQDNAGTFDRLIPLLSPELYIVAIDAPGHGLSSHKPYGTFYHFMELVLDVRRVVNYFKWEKFHFLGHSMGGHMALMYSSIYPEEVKSIVLLDIIKPTSRDPKYLPDATRMGIKSHLSLEQKMNSSAPVYTMEEARTRLIAGMVNEITPEAAAVILKRGCIPSSCEKGVVFSRDIRVKAIEELHKMSHEDLKAFLKRIRCKMLILLGNKSFIHRSKTPEVIDDFLDIYKKNCESLKIVKVEGNHFVHLNNPERVAPHINSFYSEHLKIKSKL